MSTIEKVLKYISEWKKKGYNDDIPDEVPDVLMKSNLAPSYKAIALAILQNDLHLTSLGFSAPKSEWYSILKRIEIEERNSKKVS
jgi:predicted phosphoadenosine phosphosulfate sulfurtransferase